TGPTGPTGPTDPVMTMVTPGKHPASSSMFADNAKFIWDGGSTAKLWTNKGDIILKGVKKLDDGTLVATHGYGKFGDWNGWLVDNDKDGYVFKAEAGTGNDFPFEIDLKAGKDVTGEIHTH
ncbi:MAG: hypothetical protein KAH22_10455, partial [Thiotrichaceae bacterium]|nr:hypothetical protein [Thiotrichaceae bacterium]